MVRTWMRTGKWILTHDRTELRSEQRSYESGDTLDYISRNYSGYTVVK